MSKTKLIIPIDSSTLVDAVCNTKFNKEEQGKILDSLMRLSVTEYKFDINKYIRVKLLDKGYKRLADLHNEYIGIIPTWKKRDAEYYKRLADKDGYTSFQAWEFMECFGEVTKIGMTGYYSTEILIAADFLSPCL